MVALGQQAIKIFASFLLVGGMIASGYAEKIGKVSRFMCTRSKEVNLRRGPGTEYPVDWKIVKARYPLQVIAEYGIWRKVKDYDDAEGWVHQKMLAAKPRRGVVTTKTTLFTKPTAESTLAYIEPRVLINIIEVKPAWCLIEVEGHRGWIQRDHIWGLLKDE